MNNSFNYLAKHHEALTTHGPFDPVARCFTPLADEATYRMAESHADMVIADVADSLQAMSHLVTNYPNEIGSEAELLPKLGSLLRLLGDALEAGQQAQTGAANGLHGHERLAAAEALCSVIQSAKGVAA